MQIKLIQFYERLCLALLWKTGQDKLKMAYWKLSLAGVWLAVDTIFRRFLKCSNKDIWAIVPNKMSSKGLWNIAKRTR